MFLLNFILSNYLLIVWAPLCLGCYLCVMKCTTTTSTSTVLASITPLGQTFAGKARATHAHIHTQYTRAHTVGKDVNTTTDSFKTWADKDRLNCGGGGGVDYPCNSLNLEACSEKKIHILYAFAVLNQTFSSFILTPLLP